MPISAALGSSALLPAGLGFRNKIMNGDMRIAQRGTGAITAASQNQYPVDRWTANSNATNSITFQQVADAPAGFTYSVRATSGGTGAAYSSNHYTFFTQKIEGFNIADLAWGTASAKPITISFWVKTSANAIGTHAIAVENSAGTMNYVATYTVSSTSWEYKTIQIYGPTSGTFNVDNTLGINLNFTLGAGSTYDATAGVWTSGKYSVAGAVDLGALASATWQITGVQLEQNTQPTPFEQRLYGVELGLCQRYYWRSTTGLTTDGSSRHAHFRRMNQYTSVASGHCAFPVPMRAEPTVGLYNGNGLGAVDAYGVGQESYVVATGEGLSPFGIGLFVKYTNSSLTTTAAFNVDATSVTYWANIEASAEL